MSNVEIAEQETGKGFRDVTCPRCGAAFLCGANAPSCPCSEVVLSEEQLASIARQWQGCLCRACLEAIRDANTRS